MNQFYYQLLCNCNQLQQDTRSNLMGAQCITKTQQLGFTEEVIFKVMTLDYGKHTYTPLEIFTYGSEYNLWEINKIFVELGEKEFQQIMQQDRDSLFGPIEKDFRKGRYSPLYFKMAGVEVKKGKGQNKEYFAESEQKFFENWEKRFNNFKNSKTNKKKYSEIDPQELNKYKDTLKRFDLLIFKCLLKYVINISYDKCLENKVNLAKYLRAVESDFNFKFIDQDKKNSIFCYELSKLYPHVFLVQNQSSKLIKKLEKQAKSCFKFYYNDQQMIVLNKQYFKTEEFQVVDLEKEAKVFDIEGLDSQSQSLSNRGSILESNKGKDVKELQEGQVEEKKEEPVVEENPFSKIFAIASPQHLIMSIKFSNNYDINQEQVQLLSQLLEGIQLDKNKKYSNKAIIVGGILNNQFPNLNGYNFYPMDDQDITYYKRPLPLCLEMIDCDDSSIESEQAEAGNKIITNMQITQQYITLIDGKTTANKRSKNVEADSDESDSDDDVAPTANKQFQNYEEEEDYNFHKKASETTIIPCEIHPFESYLVQVEISTTKQVQKQESQANGSIKNSSMGV